MLSPVLQMNVHGRAREIFVEACKLDAAQRGRFVEQTCGGDGQLRAQVEALFNEARTSEGRAVVAPARGETPGAMIGRYKLLQLLGEGGFGSVWMAEQTEPVKRRVALKIIKLGMDTRQVIARFAAERQALALMDHPGIARVFDAGATDTGRPYFVMELVKGEPITEYCDRNSVSITQRLELFAEVCHAVQHAHTKGIIHRDLKPTNILVSTQDGRPHAKVIDFGIAKATVGNLTEKTLFTEHRQLVGTPEYMSPEQAEGGLDIDTRTDVYSLGVLLYELLVGQTPFDARSLRSAAYAEIQRIIREIDPPAPSTRLSQSQTLSTVAAHRHVESAKLTRLIRGELDWIAMKCLEKDRQRRYETANGLAMDIRRYLAGEPVVAAPPSAGYRMRKFVRRNRGPVGAAAALFAMLLAGLAGTLWQARVAATERDAARLAETEQRRLAESETAARRQADRKTIEAEKAQAASEAITSFVIRSLQSSNPYEGGKQDMLVTEAMQNALAQLDDGAFTNERETEADLRRAIATILRGNGRAAEAEMQFRQALSTYQTVFSGDHPKLAHTLNELGLAVEVFDRYTDAQAFFAQALEMRQRLYDKDHPDVGQSMTDVAAMMRQQKQFVEAEPLLQEALAMKQRLFSGDHLAVADGFNELGILYQDMDRYEESADFYKRAGDMRQRLLKGDHPLLAESLGNVAGAKRDLAQDEEAERLMRQAVEMERRLFKEAHPEVAGRIQQLARMLEKRGAAAEALPLHREALEMRRRLFNGDHSEIAQSLNNMAAALMLLGQYDEARRCYVEALDMRRRLYPGDDERVASSLRNLAVALERLDRWTDAEPVHREALEMRQRLFTGDHDSVAQSFDSLGRVQHALGRTADAERMATQACDMFARLSQEDTDDEGVALLNLAAVLIDLRPEDAVVKADEGLAMLKQVYPKGHSYVARGFWRAAGARLAAGNATEALPMIEQCIEMAEKLLPDDHPDLPKYRKTLADCRAAISGSSGS